MQDPHATSCQPARKTTLPALAGILAGVLLSACLDDGDLAPPASAGIERAVTNGANLPSAAALEGTSDASANIFSLTINSSAEGADLWSEQTGLRGQDVTYADRPYRFTKVPTLVRGADWIRPAADSKSFTGDTLVTFNVAFDSDVYVALDVRTARPDWLVDWAQVCHWPQVCQTITSEYPGPEDVIAPIEYNLYTKRYAAGSTVELGNNGSTQEPTYIPIVKARKVSGLTVESTAAGAHLWNTRAALTYGNQAYADRAYTFTSIPDTVMSADWIQPAADSKSFTGTTLARFDVPYGTDVYIALDARTAPPAWLSGWAAIGETIIAEDPGGVIQPIIYELYRKRFVAGSTVELGNNGSAQQPTYIVIVKTPPQVTGLAVDGNAAGASLWNLKANLQIGDQVYADRAYTFTSIPEILQWADWIQPAADSKTFTGATLAAFNVSWDGPYGMTVYVALDARTMPPAWLSGWTPLGETISAEHPTGLIQPIVYNLYMKGFAGDSVVELGNNGSTEQPTYIAIVDPHR